MPPRLTQNSMERTRNARSPSYPVHTSSPQLPTPIDLFCTGLMGDNSSRISHVPACLTNRNTVSLHSMGVCIGNNLGR